MLGLCVVAAAGCEDGSADGDDAGAADGASDDARTGDMTVPGRDADRDAAPTDQCTYDCREAMARCPSSEGIECAGLCATYGALAVGCEPERDALYGCGFDETCGSCSTEEGALSACIGQRSTDVCFTWCRAAREAGCAPPDEICECIAAFYMSELSGCHPQREAAFACLADRPCEQEACASEIEAADFCLAGCTAGQTVCDRRCVDIARDRLHCGQCGNDCGPLGECVGGACECSSGSHQCPGLGCVALDDPAACGDACTSCPAPAHGRATCSGDACGFVCDAGFVATGDRCVPDCPSGEHACGDTCVGDDDPTACGAACDRCSTPPDGVATCVASRCDFICNDGFERVGLGCYGACSSPECDLVRGGCPAGTSCVARTDGPPTCVTPGVVARGAACATTADCVAGHHCFRNECRPYCCDAPGSCSADEACNGTLRDASGAATGVLVCAGNRCNSVAQTGCDPGEGCYLDPLPICLVAGTRPEGDICSSINDCVPGTTCVRPSGGFLYCARICNAATMTGCDAGETCSNVRADWPELGVCRPL